MTSAVVLLSGGMASAATLGWARAHYDAVQALSFSVDVRRAAALDASRDIATLAGVAHTVVDLVGIAVLAPPPPPGAVLGPPPAHNPPPLRSTLLLTCAASYADGRGLGAIASGIRTGDAAIYPDTARASLDSLEGVLGLPLVTPVLAMTDRDLVELAQSVDALPLLGLSYGCDTGQTPQCGACPSCGARKAAFLDAGVVDPTVYAS